ncbi:uncharacterized protein [Panulirus ornatus]|uniref:uncharacterized protein n=1 Tax=Panulirus ornatus TaxID=150431 RepID=UPI003A8AD499
MLKHVTYRSTSSLGRASSDLSCRGSSVSPDTMSLKGDLPSSPELTLKGSNDLVSPDTMSLKDEALSDTMSLKGGMTLKNFPSPDTISLHSTLSFSSLATGRLSSRCSSTTSLTEQQTTPVKVYLRSLRPDIEYKTVSLSSTTTCRQLIIMLLAKFRLRHRDPNLFFLTMEVVVRTPGGGAPARRLLVLEDHACPAELQQCRPRGEARFSVGVRRGGLLRVHDSILMAGSQYKSLLVSYRTTAEELVQLLLNCYSNKDNPKHYTVHEVNKNPYSDRPLQPDECPLLVQSEWPRAARANMAFVLRRNVNYALSLKSRLSWRRSLDQSSTDTESEHEEHNTTIGSLISASSVSSALSISSHGSMSSTSSVSSRESSSSNVSECSDASSSSGVSSASSPMASPTPSPTKTSPLSCAVQSLEKKGTAELPIPSIVTSKPPTPPTTKITTVSSVTKTTAMPPTPVPRTILNTATSTAKSKSLPTLSSPPENHTSSSADCATSTTTCSSTSTSVSTSTATTVTCGGQKGESRPPPLPIRRTCCRNYENCFYI